MLPRHIYLNLSFNYIFLVFCFYYNVASTAAGGWFSDISNEVDLRSSSLPLVNSPNITSEYAPLLESTPPISQQRDSRSPTSQQQQQQQKQKQGSIVSLESDSTREQIHNHDLCRRLFPKGLEKSTFHQRACQHALKSSSDSLSNRDREPTPSLSPRSPGRDRPISRKSTALAEPTRTGQQSPLKQLIRPQIQQSTPPQIQQQSQLLGKLQKAPKQRRRYTIESKVARARGKKANHVRWKEPEFKRVLTVAKGARIYKGYENLTPDEIAVATTMVQGRPLRTGRPRQSNILNLDEIAAATTLVQGKQLLARRPHQSNVQQRSKGHQDFRALPLRRSRSSTPAGDHRPVKRTKRIKYSSNLSLSSKSPRQHPFQENRKRHELPKGNSFSPKQQPSENTAQYRNGRQYSTSRPHSPTQSHNFHLNNQQSHLLGGIQNSPPLPKEPPAYRIDPIVIAGWVRQGLLTPISLEQAQSMKQAGAAKHTMEQKKGMASPGSPARQNVQSTSTAMQEGNIERSPKQKNDRNAKDGHDKGRSRTNTGSGRTMQSLPKRGDEGPSPPALQPTLPRGTGSGKAPYELTQLPSGRMLVQVPPRLNAARATRPPQVVPPALNVPRFTGPQFLPSPARSSSPDRQPDTRNPAVVVLGDDSSENTFVTAHDMFMNT